MSIASHSLGEAAIAAQQDTKSSTRPPKNRLVVAKADAVTEPEAR